MEADIVLAPTRMEPPEDSVWSCFPTHKMFAFAHVGTKLLTGRRLEGVATSFPVIPLRHQNRKEVFNYFHCQLINDESAA